MEQGLLQIILTLVILMIILPSMGKYMADVFLGTPTLLSPVLEPIEEFIYRLGGLVKRDNMTATQYIRSVLLGASQISDK
jgi:K+-transporting ATPase ATPase A chain